jgi:carbon-monoxide dehydrogenase large subunit
VAIKPDTGRVIIEHLTLVDDAGTVVNPMLLEGQLPGGVVKGLGEAVMERIVYDNSGQLLTASLMDCALPRAGDIPPIILASLPTVSPVNPVGARGVGEAGCFGVPVAIVNAVLDALAPLGIEGVDMPPTSETVWRAVQGLPPRRIEG